MTTAAGERALRDGRRRRVVTIEPDWQSRLLAVITDPSVALILMMIGIYGLFFEFSNPGFVLPGVVGAICLLLGAVRAADAAGQLRRPRADRCSASRFMIAEAFLPSYGSLGIGGIIAFVIGAVMLIDTDVPGFGIPLCADRARSRW